jgi:hypothetical protein
MDTVGLVRLKGRLLAMLAVGLRVALVPAREERAAFDPAFRAAADLALSGRRAFPADQPASGGSNKGRDWQRRSHAKPTDRQKSVPGMNI